MKVGISMRRIEMSTESTIEGLMSFMSMTTGIS